MAKLTEQGKQKIPEEEWEQIEKNIEDTIKTGGLEEDDTFVGYRKKEYQREVIALVYGEDFING